MIMQDLVGYLTTKGVRVYPARDDEVTAHCFWCPPGHGGAKGKGKLYLNKNDWCYFCQVCSEKGGKVDLLLHFGDDPTKLSSTGNAIPHSVKVAAMEAYAEVCAQALVANQRALDFLQERGLSVETIVRDQFGYAPRGFSATSSILKDDGTPRFSRAVWVSVGLVTDKGREFLQGCLTIPYLRMGRVVQVRGRLLSPTPGFKYLTPGDQNVMLYGSDDLRGADRALVVEGEFDRAMVKQTLRESGRPDLEKLAVVGVPGTGTVLKLADQFKDIHRTYLGLDPDTDGDKAAAQLKAAIGGSARLARLTPDPDSAVKLDWSEFLVEESPAHPYGGHSSNDVAAVINRAEMEGKVLFTVREALQAWEDTSGEPALKLGFSGIDHAIFPGIPKGALVVPLSKTGTGKSVLLANVAANLADRRVMHVTLENTARSVVEMLVRINRFYDPLFEPSMLPERMPHWQVYDGNRIDLHKLGELIEEYALIEGGPPEVLLLDHLAYVAQGMRGTSKYEKTSDAVFLLKEASKAFDLVTVCPHQVSRGTQDGAEFDSSDARDSGSVEETADYIFSLWRPSRYRAKTAPGLPEAVQRQPDDGKILIRVLKSRTGGQGSTAALQMSNASLVMVDEHAGPKLITQIEGENADISRGIPYADILRRRRQSALGAAQGQLI